MPEPRNYGWRRDLPDPEYPRWEPPPRLLAARPPAMDMTAAYPEVYDQGPLGSCTGQAIAGDIHADRVAQGMDRSFVPSRLAIYWLERSLEGTVDQDAGAMISDGLKAVSRWGYCSEDAWPHDVRRFREKPSEEAFAEMARNRITDYARVRQTIDHVAAALASGRGVVFGFTCFEGLEAAETTRTGVVPLPRRGERRLGGHAVVAVGYDDASRLVKFRNSWGKDWGQNGYGWLPYEYVFSQQLAADFWVINSVPGAPAPPPAPAGKVRVVLEIDGAATGARVVSVG